MLRRAANLSVVLLGPLLASAAVLAAAGAVAVAELTRHTGAEAVAAAQPTWVMFTPGESAGVQIPLVQGYEMAVPDRPLFHMMADGATRPSPSGWLALPILILVVGVLALMLPIGLFARRRGVDSDATLRLLRVTGLLALLGGPVAVLVELLVARFSKHAGYWPPPGQWLTAGLLVLMGCGFLAVRQVLARMVALRDELAGVI